jgi:CHAT domain-containing protein
LTGMLLGPAVEHLQDRRLLVVADGVLDYLPLGALPDPRAPGEPLLRRHEVVALPSASLLDVLRQPHAGAPAPRTLAVLADPVFDANDSRVPHAASAVRKTPAAAPRLLRATRDAGFVDGALPRLVFSRREAQALAALVPASERRMALDFEASRATATSAELGQYRLLHFATHGFLNSSRPELSGLVLSLVDASGREQRGFLGPPDVLDLELNADLVVLSGCGTALGREISGEGLMGLARAFMYAGTPRVVASLWRVDDAATATLMQDFYSGMLRDAQRPAAALRAAQLALARERPRPYFWAAFQLQGDWR